MITFDDAFRLMMNAVACMGTERVSIDEALGRILAEDVVSDISMPPFDKSAMDGYACRRADLANELTVLETIPAGYTPQKAIGPNQCSKIMTGAVVPDGANCVIMVEYTKQQGKGKIRFIGKETRDNICLKGEDIKAGDIVLRKGSMIKVQHIAVLAAVGISNPLVANRPNVGIAATGDELIEPSQKPHGGQIRNSNSYQLTAHVKSAGGLPTNYGIVPDNRESMNSILKKAISENNVIILSGGVSAGDFDIVPQILAENGFSLLFEKIAIKPGRPMVFGVKKLPNGKKTGNSDVDQIFCFGMPGNPVSVFTMFELLARPFLAKMMGHDFRPHITYGFLEKKLTRKNTEVDSWMPVQVEEGGTVTLVEYHGSAHINAMCQADGLLCVPAGVEEIKEGSKVAVRQI